MLSNKAKEILKQHVAMKSQRKVATELGLSPATISLVIADKYQANTGSIEDRVMNIYGTDGCVSCPVLGKINLARCAENYTRAQAIRFAGNPATIRLFAACRKCKLRN